MSTPDEPEHPQTPNHAAEHEPHLQPAAGPWQEEPPEDGYAALCEIEAEGGIKYVDVVTRAGGWTPRGIDGEETDWTILRYAEIYSEHA